MIRLMLCRFGIHAWRWMIAPATRGSHETFAIKHCALCGRVKGRVML